MRDWWQSTGKRQLALIINAYLPDSSLPPVLAKPPGRAFGTPAPMHPGRDRGTEFGGRGTG